MVLRLLLYYRSYITQEFVGHLGERFREKRPSFGAKAYVHKGSHYDRLLPLNVP